MQQLKAKREAVMSDLEKQYSGIIDITSIGVASFM